CLKNAVSKALQISAQKHLDSALLRLVISKHGGVPAQLKNIHYFRQTEKLGQMIKAAPSLDNLIGDELVHFAEELTKSKLKAPAQPQLLLSLPSKEVHSFDNLKWHVDITANPHGPIPGVQFFVLIRDVKPHGGATVIKPGSHLVSKNSTEELPMLELHGKAGDVYLMDMRVLHSPSINALKEIRMMMTKRYMRVA